MSFSLSGVTSSTERIGRLLQKELDFMAKDKISIGVLFMLPIAIILIAAIADMPSLADPAPIWIIDDDDSQLSNELYAKFAEQEYLITTSSLDNSSITLEKGIDLLPTRKLSAIIYIPRGFEEDIQANGTTEISIYLDALDYIQMMMLEGQIQGVLVSFQLDNFVFESEIFYFPDIQPPMPDDILFIAAPMILGNALFASMNLISSQSIVGDIPLRRILIAPTRRWEVIVAKTISHGALGFLQTTISLFMVEFLFGQPFRGVFLDIFLIVFLSCMSGVTMGIFFSVISSTRLQASQYFLFAYILFALFQINLRIGPILTFIPEEQTAKALINVAYRGQSLLETWEPIVNLMIITTLFFFLAIFIFNRKKELV